MQQTIVNLIEMLRRFDDEVSTEEVLDWIWFTAYRNRVTAQAEATVITPDSESNKTKTPPDLPPTRQDQNSLKTEARADLYSPTRRDQSGRTDTPQGGLPFRTPGGRALPHTLDITRALRPLNRRIPSPEQFGLDEEATAQHIAQNDVWLPVFKPQPMMRWLELALVIDGSPSMRLWHHTIKEFRQLLEQQGAFRDVRVWTLKTSGRDHTVSLYTELGETRRHFKELINPAQKRLILVVTDCVSPAWQSKTLIHWLDVWGREHPLTLVHLLPQELWPQTCLRSARLVKLSSPGPAASNHYLRVQQSVLPWLEKPTKESCPIPLTTLEPDFLAGWAKFIAGSSGIVMPGFVLQPKAFEPHHPPQTEADAAELLRRFRAVASPTAFKLACFLAAALLRLPIMRLVQQVMLRESQQVHLAEFFLSGLIKRITPDKEIGNPDEIEYDFVDDSLQDKLLDAGLITDAVQVLEEVSKYIKKHYGSTIDFQDIIANPQGIGEIQVAAGYERFAKVGAKVLRRLGGSYALIADRLENLKTLNSQGSPTSHPDFSSPHNLSGEAISHKPLSQNTYLSTDSLGDTTNLSMKAYDFRYEDLYEEEKLNQLNLTTISIFDTGIWDHQLPFFAKEHKFDQRLGICFKDATEDRLGENRSVKIDEVIEQLLSQNPPNRILASVPRALFPLSVQESDSQKKWRDPKQWTDIAITDLYEGYALIGPKIEMPPWLEEVKKRVPAEGWATKSVVIHVINHIYDKGCTVWVYDKRGKDFVKFLVELAHEITETRWKEIKTEFVSEGIPLVNRDPIVDKLLQNKSDFGVGTSISRALAERVGFEIYLDAEDIPQMLKECFRNDEKRRSFWQTKFNRLYIHNTWQINIPQKEWDGEKYKEIVLKLASIALYTVAYIRSFPEQYVRFISARLHHARLNGAFPLDTGAVRSAISACYRFFSLEEYSETFFDRDGAFPYSSPETPDLTEDLVAGDILYELLQLRGKCIEHIKELAGRIDSDGLDRARDLKKRAWKHFQIFNYLDAERLFQEARNIVAGQSPAVTPDK